MDETSMNNAALQRAVDVLREAALQSSTKRPSRLRRLAALSTVDGQSMCHGCRCPPDRSLLLLLSLFGFTPLQSSSRRANWLSAAGWLLAVAFLLFAAVYLLDRFRNDTGDLFDVGSSWDLQVLIFAVFHAYTVVVFKWNRRYIAMIIKQVLAYKRGLRASWKLHLMLTLPPLFEIAHSLLAKTIKTYHKCFVRQDDNSSACLEVADEARDAMYMYMMSRHNVASVAFAAACICLSNAFNTINRSINDLQRSGRDESGKSLRELWYDYRVARSAVIAFDHYTSVAGLLNFVYLVWTVILAVFILISRARLRWTDCYYTIMHLTHASYAFLLYFVSAIRLNEKAHCADRLLIGYTPPEQDKHYAKWIRDSAKLPDGSISLGHFFVVSRLTAITVSTLCITLFTFWTRLQWQTRSARQQEIG